MTILWHKHLTQFKFLGQSYIQCSWIKVASNQALSGLESISPPHLVQECTRWLGDIHNDTVASHRMCLLHSLHPAPDTLAPGMTIHRHEQCIIHNLDQHLITNYDLIPDSSLPFLHLQFAFIIRSRLRKRQIGSQLMKWWMKELMLALKSCDRIVIINKLPNESRHCQWWSWHGHHWKQIFRSRSVGAVRAGSQWNESWVTIKHGGSLIWIKCRAPNLFSYLTNLKFSIAVKFS